ncbi:hypothetical protein NC651_031354 [Populus alba x Populus x berolinensis]|nr:hypothetical protein NC651_031354 [Populus alba x Populus x berolinensis]
MAVVLGVPINGTIFQRDNMWTLLAGGRLCILLFVSSSDASFETFQDGSISQDIAVKNFISNVLMIFQSEESKSARGRFSSAREAWWLWWWRGLLLSSTLNTILLF